MRGGVRSHSLCGDGWPAFIIGRVQPSIRSAPAPAAVAPGVLGGGGRPPPRPPVPSKSSGGAPLRPAGQTASTSVPSDSDSSAESSVPLKHVITEPFDVTYSAEYRSP